MTFNKYFYSSILFSIITVSIIVLFNVSMNEYGLFGNAKGKMINIWHNERTSKYLLSYNYVPANFEGILIGPSVSDNLDTKKISGFKIYNASISGGNISELKYIVENIIQRGKLKFIIICLHPYVTKDNGRKTSYINPQEYRSALGSKELVMLYMEMMSIKMGLKTSIYNEYGYNNFNIHYEKPIMPTQVNSSYTNTNGVINSINIPNGEIKFQPELIDEVAYREMDYILNLARSRKIQIFAFYYPYYITKFNEAKFNSYKDKINKLFTNYDCVWNFNGAEYFRFRKDSSNYYDKSHLSWKGAEFLTYEINDKLNIFYKRQ